MGRIFAVMILGAALFLGIAWQIGLLDSEHFKSSSGTDNPHEVVVTDPKLLGPDLFKPGPWPAIKEASPVAVDPIVLYGVMNPIDIEEVSSLVPGKILFVGEQVDDAVVAAVGSGAFLTDPYYSQTVYAGRQTFTKYYRRIYEGQTIKKGQMVALIEPGEALGQVLASAAKVKGAIAERKAASAAEEEGSIRYERAKTQYALKAINAEDLGAAKLTWMKLQAEHVTKASAVESAEADKDTADIKLKSHEIRPLLHFKQSSVKSVVRQTGATVKPGDPIVIVQNLERLQAEALIEQQYYSYLKELERAREAQGKKITATIEPSILEKPLHELPGHDRDVTSVAVSRDMKIVSGSEDKSICVWEPNGKAPLAKLEHDDAVKVVACTPADGIKNLCLAGCADGSIYLWNLDDPNEEPVKIPNNKAHGDNTAITALAFSRDGQYFASGASDGSIRIWNADGTEKYPFDPVHGVKQAHEDAVTSLHFTPQCKLISAGRDKTLRVWRLMEKGAAADGKGATIYNRSGAVGQLGVSSDGKWMLFDQTTTLKLLSVESRILKHTLNVPVNSTPFDTLALFSPDDSLILTAGASEGRLQLWRAPEGDHRGFEVRQFGTPNRQPVTCAAFSSQAGKGGRNSFAVSGSGQKVFVWAIPTKDEVRDHRIRNVEMTLKSRTVDSATGNSKVGFEVANPDGRFEAGRPVTIVIE